MLIRYEWVINQFCHFIIIIISEREREREINRYTYVLEFKVHYAVK
jgi:hypothetical protein